MSKVPADVGVFIFITFFDTCTECVCLEIDNARMSWYGPDTVVGLSCYGPFINVVLRYFGPLTVAD